MKLMYTIIPLFAVSLAAGCASESGRAVPAGAGTGAGAAPAAGQTTAKSARRPATRVVQFAFDSAELGREALPVLEEWGAYLVATPDARVQLDGHCDERGTREYNIGLGERRAGSVRAFLMARGVSGSQLTVRSFGEERPLDTAHTERAWARNRRVEVTD